MPLIYFHVTVPNVKQNRLESVSLAAPADAKLSDLQAKLSFKFRSWAFVGALTRNPPLAYELLT